MDVSIHSFQAEGDHCAPEHPIRQEVSIHSFQAEGDWMSVGGDVKAYNVSIHSFQAEGD